MTTKSFPPLRCPLWRRSVLGGRSLFDVGWRPAEGGGSGRTGEAAGVDGSLGTGNAT